MKTTAKLIAVLLVVAMFMAFGLTAYADAPNTGTIIIARPENPGSTGGRDGYVGDYEIYKLFDASVAMDENGNATGAISYVCTDTQKEIEGFDTFFKADAANNVSATEAAVGEDGFLSAAAIAWIREHLDELGEKIEPVPFWNHNSSNTDEIYFTGGTHSWGNEDNFTVHNLPFGYYFVNSHVGSAVMITSTKPTAEITDKNTPPTFEKTITRLTDQEGRVHNEDIQPEHDNRNDYDYGHYDDAHQGTVQIGDTIQYTLDITARKNALAYIVRDALSEGLTLKPETIVVTLDGEVVDPANYDLLASAYGYATDINYSTHAYTTYELDPEHTVVKTGSTEDEDYDYMYGNIRIVFHQDWLDENIGGDRQIRITYDALVNSNAAVAFDTGSGSGAGNRNRAELEYGHQYYLSDDTRVYSARLVIYKYEGSGDSSSSVGNKPLNGVEFILRDERGNYYMRDEQGLIHWVESRDEATTLVTGGSAVIASIALPEGMTRNPGPDGTEGTEDDFFEGSGTVILPGPDGELNTADDRWPGGQNMYATPGADGVWGTGDEEIYGMNGSDGVIVIDGLTNGEYTLIETRPLPGYNRAADTVIKVDNNLKDGVINTYAQLKYQVDIANHTGTELPTTGGMGVTLFYVLGGMCVLLGAALLLRKKSAAEG